MNSDYKLLKRAYLDNTQKTIENYTSPIDIATKAMDSTNLLVSEVTKLPISNTVMSGIYDPLITAGVVTNANIYRYIPTRDQDHTKKPVSTELGSETNRLINIDISNDPLGTMYYLIDNKIVQNKREPNKKVIANWNHYNNDTKELEQGVPLIYDKIDGTRKDPGPIFKVTSQRSYLNYPVRNYIFYKLKLVCDDQTKPNYEYVKNSSGLKTVGNIIGTNDKRESYFIKKTNNDKLYLVVSIFGEHPTGNRYDTIRINCNKFNGNLTYAQRMVIAQQKGITYGETEYTLEQRNFFVGFPRTISVNI